MAGVVKFFEGQNIFVTGGSGFLGKVLLEKLLRSCPDVGNIFMLVRPKKGKDPIERVKNIISLPVITK
jgi:thioester reductase-like protein